MQLFLFFVHLVLYWNEINWFVFDWYLCHCSLAIFFSLGFLFKFGVQLLTTLWQNKMLTWKKIVNQSFGRKKNEIKLFQVFCLSIVPAIWLIKKVIVEIVIIINTPTCTLRQLLAKLAAMLTQLLLASFDFVFLVRSLFEWPKLASHRKLS